MIKNIFRVSFPKGAFAKDVLITILFQISILVLNVLVLKYSSLHMSLEGFGLFNVAKRSASLAAYVFLFGLGISIPRFIAVYRASGNPEGEYSTFFAGLGLVSILSVIGLLIGLVFKSSCARLLFGDEKFVYAILPLIINAIGICFSTFITSYFRGINNMWQFNFIQFILQLFVLLILFLITNSPIDLILWWGISWIIASLIYLLYIFKFWVRPDFKIISKKTIKSLFELVHFGAFRTIGEFSLFGYFALPLVIISSRKELSSVAILSIPISFFQLITAIFGFAGYVLLPHVSAGITNGNFRSIKRDLKRMEIIYLLGSILAVFALLTLTPFITKIFFSSKYNISVPLTRIISIGVIPYVFYLLYRNPLDAISRFPWNSVNLLISLVLLITWTMLSHSLISYAMAYASSSVLLGILSSITWNRINRLIQA